MEVYLKWGGGGGVSVGMCVQKHQKYNPGPIKHCSFIKVGLSPSVDDENTLS